MLVHRHPFFELAHVTARSEAGARLDDLHPRTRVPLELEQWDADVQSDVEAALVCWPHRVAAPAVAALRERGVRVVDLSADFRLRDRGIYEDWYGEHGAPALFGQGVYGLPELHRERIAGADLVANPGCYPTAALLALAPLARGGLIGDVVIDAKSGVSGAGREPTASTHFVSVAENMTPYKVERHRHTPEIEQELAGQGAAVTITFTPHLVPLAQGELVSCYVTPAREHTEDEVLGALRRGLRARAVRRAAARPARRARRARDELLPPVGALRRAHGPDPRVRGDRQPLEGSGVAGRPEPQPDVRARRARGPAVTAFSSRWVEPPAGVTERPGGGLAAGFRAAGVSRGHQAVRRPRPRAAGLLGARRGQRRALHALRSARRAGAAVPLALPPRRARARSS